MTRQSSSCRATSLSSSFDKTARFDIGLYDFSSAGSRSVFFKSGVMYADLNTLGTDARTNERLNSSTRNGPRRSMLSLSSRVGSGSDAHCLSGRSRMAAATSSAVSGRKSQRRLLGGTVENVGCGASLVDARTPATFSSKNDAHHQRLQLQTMKLSRDQAAYQWNARVDKVYGIRP